MNETGNTRVDWVDPEIERLVLDTINYNGNNPVKLESQARLKAFMGGEVLQGAADARRLFAKMNETQTTETPWTEEQIIQALLAYNGEDAPLLAAQAVVIAYQSEGNNLTASEAAVKIGRPDLLPFLAEASEGGLLPLRLEETQP